VAVGGDPLSVDPVAELATQSDSVRPTAVITDEPFSVNDKAESCFLHMQSSMFLRVLLGTTLRPRYYYCLQFYATVCNSLQKSCIRCKL